MGRGGTKKSKRGQAFASSVSVSEASPFFADDGTIRWQNSEGELHRKDGPALTSPDGSEAWYRNGLLHRKGGPAVINAFPDPGLPLEEWYKNGLLHREDGPARVFSDGRQEWWQEGELHRVGGPALIDSNGREDYFLRGKGYTKEEWRNR